MARRDRAAHRHQRRSRRTQLRGWIQDLVVTDRSRLTLIFESFGYKHGVPLDADFVFDARCCCPNPHYDPKLRPLTGRDAAVVEFLERETQAGLLVEDIQRFLQRWLPRFVLDQRASITVAIGCTGGRHRSVYIANQLAERFRSEHPWCCATAIRKSEGQPAMLLMNLFSAAGRREEVPLFPLQTVLFPGVAAAAAYLRGALHGHGQGVPQGPAIRSACA